MEICAGSTRSERDAGSSADADIRFEHVQSTDADHAARSLDWLADMRYMQSSTAAFEGSIRRVDFCGVSLVLESQNCSLLKQGVLHGGKCTISFLCKPREQSRFNSRHVSPTGLAFLPTGVDFDVHVNGEPVVYFAIDEKRLCERAAAEGIWLGRHGRQLHVLEGVDNAPLVTLAEDLAQCISDPQHAQRLPRPSVLFEQFMDSLLDLLARPSWRAPSSAVLKAHARTRMAREYIEQHMDGPITIADLCRALSVSRHTLNTCFHSTYGMAPQAYLRLARLNRVHRLLKACRDGTATITALAMRAGFLHPARMASDYRNLFGELPSQTLCRALSGKVATSSARTMEGPAGQGQCSRDNCPSNPV